MSPLSKRLLLKFCAIQDFFGCRMSSAPSSAAQADEDLLAAVCARPRVCMEVSTHPLYGSSKSPAATTARRGSGGNLWDGSQGELMTQLQQLESPWAPLAAVLEGVTSGCSQKRAEIAEVLRVRKKRALGTTTHRAAF